MREGEPWRQRRHTGKCLRKAARRKRTSALGPERLRAAARPVAQGEEIQNVVGRPPRSGFVLVSAPRNAPTPRGAPAPRGALAPRGHPAPRNAPAPRGIQLQGTRQLKGTI